MGENITCCHAGSLAADIQRKQLTLNQPGRISESQSIRGYIKDQTSQSNPASSFDSLRSVRADARVDRSLAVSVPAHVLTGVHGICKVASVVGQTSCTVVAVLDTFVLFHGESDDFDECHSQDDQSCDHSDHCH